MARLAAVLAVLPPELTLSTATPCRVPLAKEDEYRYISGPSGLAQTCNTAQPPRSPNSDIVQLTGSGFKQLQPWSAVALREVSCCDQA